MRLSLGLAAIAVTLAAAGCGGTGGGAVGNGSEYPLVTETPPESQAVTGPDGRVTERPVKPAESEVAPSPTCERVIATFHDGSQPAKRPIVVPPAPGLRAQRISDRQVELTWWFESLPDDCRPAAVLLSIVANDVPGSLPWNEELEVTGLQGSFILEYPEVAPGSPEVAMAVAYMADGHRSRTARILIEG